MASRSKALFEDLAMNGFVVPSLSHLGDSLLTTFDDERTVAIDRERAAYRAVVTLQRDPHATLEPYGDCFEELRSAHDDRARRSVSSSRTNRVMPRGCGHLTFERVGVFGRALGGVVAGRVAQLDRRVRTAINYHAPQSAFDDAARADGELRRQLAPTCFAYADASATAGVTLRADRLNDALLASAPRGSCSLFVRGATHLSFTDMNNTTLLRWTPVLGRVDSRAMATVLRAFATGYFEHHLGDRARPSVPAALGELRWSEA